MIDILVLDPFFSHIPCYYYIFITVAFVLWHAPVYEMMRPTCTSVSVSKRNGESETIWSEKSLAPCVAVLMWIVMCVGCFGFLLCNNNKDSTWWRRWRKRGYSRQIDKYKWKVVGARDVPCTRIIMHHTIHVHRRPRQRLSSHTLYYHTTRIGGGPMHPSPSWHCPWWKLKQELWHSKLYST